MTKICIEVNGVWTHRKIAFTKTNEFATVSKSDGHNSSFLFSFSFHAKIRFLLDQFE